MSLPYFGPLSEKLKNELYKYLSKVFPYIKFSFVFKNDFKLCNLFNYKDRLPVHLKSCVIYSYSCTQASVPASYIGCTKRRLNDRVLEHAGLSVRTYKPLSKPFYSNILEHSLKCKCKINLDSFKILATSRRNELDLNILESLYITKLKPTLNTYETSFPLKIV